MMSIFLGLAGLAIGLSLFPVEWLGHRFGNRIRLCVIFLIVGCGVAISIIFEKTLQREDPLEMRFLGLLLGIVISGVVTQRRRPRDPRDP